MRVSLRRLEIFMCHSFLHGVLIDLTARRQEARILVPEIVYAVVLGQRGVLFYMFPFTPEGFSDAVVNEAAFIFYWLAFRVKIG